MHIVQTVARTPAGVAAAIASLQAVQPNLILVFGAAEYFDQTDLGTRLAAAFPEAASLGCSTAGEITAKGVDDGSCSFTGLRLERTRLTRGRTELRGMEDSFAAGQRLARQLLDPELKAVLVFGPGVQVNGSALVDGMSSLLGGGLPITGGLAGDGGAFRQTFTLGEGGVGPPSCWAKGWRTALELLQATQSSSWPRRQMAAQMHSNCKSPGPLQRFQRNTMTAPFACL